MSPFFQRQTIIPFETSFAAFCIFSGIAGVTKLGMVSQIFDSLLGQPLASVFNAGFILGGLGLVFGIGLGRRRFEMFGLILIITSLLVRALVVYDGAKFNSFAVNVYPFTAIFITGCIVRMYGLVQQRTLVQTPQEPRPHPDVQ